MIKIKENFVPVKKLNVIKNIVHVSLMGLNVLNFVNVKIVSIVIWLINQWIKIDLHHFIMKNNLQIFKCLNKWVFKKFNLLNIQNDKNTIF
jgi:hypothetical protein